MSGHPATVRAGATAAEAARLMDRHQASCLPVVDEDGKLSSATTRRMAAQEMIGQWADARCPVTSMA